jgi:hypothetical protein
MSTSHQIIRTHTIIKAFDEVVGSTPETKAKAFSSLHLVISNWLRELPFGDGHADEQEMRARRDFARTAQVYLRALSTYPAASDEWSEVFWGFRQLFARWIARTESDDKPEPPVTITAGAK